MRTLNKIARLLLIVLIFFTGLLYLLANMEKVEDMFSMIASAAESLKPAPTPDPPATDAGITGEPEPVRTEPQAVPEPVVFTAPRGELPEFPYQQLLESLPESVLQVVVVLAEGTRGNVYITERDGDIWYVSGGPFFCRTGSGGVSDTPGEAVTLLGAVSISGGDYPFYSAKELTAPTKDGRIAMLPRDVTRILGLLDASKSPVAAVCDAGAVSHKLLDCMPEDFVFLSDAVPGALEEPRYSTDENFMGRPMEGYFGHRIVVSAEVGRALKKVQDALAGRGLGLLVYDGYRPQMAVDEIFEWIDDHDDLLNKEEYYPNLSKDELKGIYLVEQSPHTKGIAVDLTLCDLVTGKPIDMGTGFDFFSPISWYRTDSITPFQQNNRKILRNAMTAAGFSPYDKEWWHFNLNSSTRRGTYNFVIPQ